METKPGWKTTEFWLSLLAMIIGALASSGAFEGGSFAAKALALGASTLAALGYTAVRGWTKTNDRKAKALEARPLSAASSPRA